MSRGFWTGVVVGVAGVWAYHHFMGLPGGKGS
jgi:hypothetical protein